MALSALQLAELSSALTALNAELKTYTLIDMLPGWYNTTPGSRMFAILKAIGEGDSDIAEVEHADSAMTLAKRGLFSGSATGAALGVNGQNFGIARPQSAQFNDEVYRRLIQAIAYAPRGSLKTIYDVVAAFLGPQSEAGWQIFDPGGNLIVIWTKSVVDIRTPETATYLHPSPTELGGPTDVLAKYPGDYFLPDALFEGGSAVVREGITGGIIPGPQGDAAHPTGTGLLFYPNDASVLLDPYPHVHIPSGPFTGLYDAAAGDVFLTLSGAVEPAPTHEYWNRTNKRQTVVVGGLSTVLSFESALVVLSGDLAHPELNTAESDVQVPTHTVEYVVPVDPTHNTDTYRLLLNHPHKLGATPSPTVGALASSVIPPPSGNGTISWKLGDIFTSDDDLFLPNDVGATIVISYAATPTNNRVARVLGYIDANHVVISPGETPLTADANNGAIRWQLHRGVLDNIVVLTGNRIIQDLTDTLNLVKMAGVVVRIGDVTT
jgi:hypothetical protein